MCPKYRQLTYWKGSTRHQQPTSPALHRSPESCYHDDPAFKDYSLRAQCTLSSSEHNPNSLLRGGGGYVGSPILYLPSREPDGTFSSSDQ